MEPKRKQIHLGRLRIIASRLHHHVLTVRTTCDFLIHDSIKELCHKTTDILEFLAFFLADGTILEEGGQLPVELAKA